MPRLWPACSWMSAIALISSAVFCPRLIAAQFTLMPLPAHITQETGEFSIDGGFRVAFEGYTEPRLEHAVERFRTNLTRETGILHFPETSSATQATFTIRTTGTSAPVQQLAKTSPIIWRSRRTAFCLLHPIRSASCTACRHFCNW